MANKLKRMIYIYEENLPFYEGLENKSQWINDKMQDERLNKRIGAMKPGETSVEGPGPVATEPLPQAETQLGTLEAMDAPRNIDDPGDPEYHPDPRIRDTRKQLRAMEERDRERLGN